MDIEEYMDISEWILAPVIAHNKSVFLRELKFYEVLKDAQINS